MALHVLPISDLREHEESPDCWCAPRVEGYPGCDEDVIIHNSLDGRERFETDWVH